eukprot:3226629-Prorocentrum_lima.AAC.1
MAEELVVQLRGQLLRDGADLVHTHFQGVQQMARVLRRQNVISSRTAKQLTMVDDCYNLLRHITSVSAKELVASFRKQCEEHAAEAPADAPP